MFKHYEGQKIGYDWAVGVKDDIIQREAGPTTQRLKLWEAPLPKGVDYK